MGVPPPGTPPPGTPPPPPGTPPPPPGDGGPGGVENDGVDSPTPTEGVDSVSLTFKDRERALIERLYNMVNAAHDWMLFVASNGGLTPEDVQEMLNEFEKMANDPSYSAAERTAARQIANQLQQILDDPLKGGAHYLILILSDPQKYLQAVSELAKAQYDGNQTAREQALLDAFNELNGGGGHIDKEWTEEIREICEDLDIDPNRVIVITDENGSWMTWDDGNGNIRIVDVTKEEFVHMKSNNPAFWNTSQIEQSIISRDLRSAGLPPNFDLNNVPPSIQNLMKRFQGRTLLTTQESTTIGEGTYYVLNTDRLKMLQDQMMNKLTACVILAGILQQVWDVFYDMWIVLIDPYCKKPSTSVVDSVGKLMKTWTRMFKMMVSDMNRYKDRINEATTRRKMDEAYDQAMDDAESFWCGVADWFTGGKYTKSQAMPYYYKYVAQIENERKQIAQQEAAAVKQVLYSVAGDLDELGDSTSRNAGNQIRSLLSGDMLEDRDRIEERAITFQGMTFGYTVGGNAGFIGVDEDAVVAIMDKMRNIMYTKDIVQYLRAKSREMFSDVIRSLMEMPKKRNNLEKIMELMKMRRNIQSEWLARYIEALQSYCQHNNNYIQAEVEREKAEDRAGWAIFALVLSFLTIVPILAGMWWSIIMGAKEQSMLDYDNFYEEGGLEIDPGKIARGREEGVEESEIDRVQRLERLLAYHLGRMNANYNNSLITNESQGFKGVDQTQLVQLNMMLSNIITALSMIAQLREAQGRVKNKIWADVFKLERSAILKEGQIVEYMQGLGDITKMKSGIQIQATNEKVQEMNKQRAEQVKADQMFRDIWTGLMDIVAAVAAIVGACMMCTPLAAVGFGLVAGAAVLAVVSAGLKYHFAKQNYNDAAKIDYKSDENIVKINQRQSQAAQMDSSENQRIANMYDKLYVQMLKQVNALSIYSARTSAGDGYYALDIGAVAEAGKKVAYLSMAQAIIMNLNVSRDRIQSAIWEVTFELEPGSKAKEDIIKSVAMRNFSSVMDTLKARMGQINTEIQALNRKETAKKMMDAARIALIIACVTAPIKIVAAAVGAFSSAANAALTAALINLGVTIGESIANIIIAVGNVNESMGKLEKAHQDMMAAIETAFDHEKDPIMQLVKECLKEAKIGIKSTAGGKVTYDKSSVVKTKHKMEVIFRNRELIQNIREAANQVWQQTFAASNGFASVRTDQGMVSMADQALKQLAMSSIDNIEKNVKSKVERMNQINDAERKMWTTIVTSAINTAASAASAIAAGAKAPSGAVTAITYSSIAASFLGNMITNLIYDATRDQYKPSKGDKAGKSASSAVDMESQVMMAEVNQAEQSMALTAKMDAIQNQNMYGQIIGQAVKQLAVQLLKDFFKGMYDPVAAIKDNERQIEILQAQRARLQEAVDHAKKGDVEALKAQRAKIDAAIKRLEIQITQCKDKEKRKLLEGQLNALREDFQTLGKLMKYAEVMRDLLDKKDEHDKKTADRAVEAQKEKINKAAKNIYKTLLKLQAQRQAILDTAAKENRELTATEKARIARIEAKFRAAAKGLPEGFKQVTIDTDPSVIKAQIAICSSAESTAHEKVEELTARLDKLSKEIIPQLKTKEAALRAEILVPIEKSILEKTGTIASKKAGIVERVKGIKTNKFKWIQAYRDKLIGIIRDSSQQNVSQQLDSFFGAKGETGHLPKAFTQDSEIMQHFKGVLKGAIARANADGKMSGQKLGAIQVWIQERGGNLAATPAAKLDMTNMIMSIVQDKTSKFNTTFANEFLGQIAAMAQNSQTMFQNFQSSIKGQRSSFDTVIMEMLIAAARMQKTSPTKATAIQKKCQELMTLYQKAKAALKSASTKDVHESLKEYAGLMKEVVKQDAFMSAFKTAFGKEGEVKYKQLTDKIKDLGTQIDSWKGKTPNAKQMEVALQIIKDIQEMVLGEKLNAQLGASRGTDARILQSILLNAQVAGYIAVISNSDNPDILDKAINGLSELNSMDLISSEKGEQSSSEVTRALQEVREQNEGLFKKIMERLVDKGHDRLAGDVLTEVKEEAAMQIVRDLLDTDKKKKTMKLLKKLIKDYKDSTKMSPAQKIAFEKLIAGLFADVDMEVISEAEKGLPEGEKTLLQACASPENRELAKAVIGILVESNKDEKAVQILVGNLEPSAAQEVLAGLMISQSVPILSKLKPEQIIKIFKDNPDVLSGILEKMPISPTKGTTTTTIIQVVEALAEKNNAFAIKIVAGFKNPNLARLLAAKALGISSPEDITAEQIKGAGPDKATMMMLYISGSDDGRKHFREKILPTLSPQTYIKMFNDNPKNLALFLKDFDAETQKAISIKIINGGKLSAKAYVEMFNKNPMLFASLLSKCDPEVQKAVIGKMYSSDKVAAAKMYQLLKVMAGPNIFNVDEIPGLKDIKIPQEKVPVAEPKAPPTRPDEPSRAKPAVAVPSDTTVAPKVTGITPGSVLFKGIFSDPNKSQIEQFKKAVEKKSPGLMEFFERIQKPTNLNPKEGTKEHKQLQDFIAFLKSMKTAQIREFVVYLKSKGIILPPEIFKMMMPTVAAAVGTVKMTPDQREKFCAVLGIMDSLRGKEKVGPEFNRVVLPASKAT